MYPDELPLLLRRVEKRRVRKEQQRISDKLQLIQIVSIPHQDPKKPSRLPRELKRQHRELDRMLDPEKGEHLDREGVAQLKTLKAQVDAIRR